MKKRLGIVFTLTLLLCIDMAFARRYMNARDSIKGAMVVVIGIMLLYYLLRNIKVYIKNYTGKVVIAQEDEIERLQDDNNKA